MNGRRPIIFILVGLMTLTTPFAVQRANAQTANTSTGQSIVEQVNCDVTVVGADGKVTVNRACQINDFINLFIYLSKWSMSILAVLATLMFIYGGFQFVTAGGRSSKVDEGKRVLSGTVIGTIIALTAYVIINTTVTAFSGTTLASSNPFGVIATVFGDNNPANTINGQTIRRAFSGAIQDGGSNPGTESAACRLDTSDWVRNCTDPLQVYCADSGTSGEGTITKLQTQLTSLGCDCGTADGCFGKDTVACVRQFQIANDLPPSGVVDIATKGRIDSGGLGCGGTQDTAVVAKLPDTVLAKTEGGDASGKCCIVNDGATDLYCVNGISTRACQALGDGSTNYSGACGSGETAGRCGYCSKLPTPTPTTSACFMSVSSNWCQTTQNLPVTTPATRVYYFNNSCMGQCATCINSLRASF